MTNHPSRNRRNRASRAASIALTVPADLSFADLRLSRSHEGISFDLSALRRLCEASGISIDQFTETHEDNVAGLIVSWYAAHLANGGASDPVADDLVREALASDQDHTPGQA